MSRVPLCAPRNWGVVFRGTGEQIDEMIKKSIPAQGDIFQDYNVKGNRLEPPGLDALFAELEKDPSITHVLIPHNERLVRPDEIVEGILLEMKFRQHYQVTVV
jgi:hypothetical protein